MGGQPFWVSLSAARALMVHAFAATSLSEHLKATNDAFVYRCHCSNGSPPSVRRMTPVSCRKASPRTCEVGHPEGRPFNPVRYGTPSPSGRDPARCRVRMRGDEEWGRRPHLGRSLLSALATAAYCLRGVLVHAYEQGLGGAFFQGHWGRSSSSRG